MMGWLSTSYLHRRTSEDFVVESEMRCGDTRFRFRFFRHKSVKAMQNKVFGVLGELSCVHRRTSRNLQKPIVFVEVRRCFAGYGFEGGDLGIFGMDLWYILDVRRFEGWNPYGAKALRRTPYRLG